MYRDWRLRDVGFEDGQWFNEDPTEGLSNKKKTEEKSRLSTGGMDDLRAFPDQRWTSPTS